MTRFGLVLLLVFSGNAWAADTDKETPLRTAVGNGVKAVQASDKRVTMMEEFLVVNQSQLALIKPQLEKVQKDIADTIFALAQRIEALEASRDEVDGESLYWQANYFYTLACLYGRQARVLEYDAMLGQIRRDNLPALDMEKHKGWRLTAKGEMSDKDAKELAGKARALLKQLAEDHKGTPWELIATRASAERWGMEWKPLAKGPQTGERQ